jgi:hypothetical protein
MVAARASWRPAAAAAAAGLLVLLAAAVPLSAAAEAAAGGSGDGGAATHPSPAAPSYYRNSSTAPTPTKQHQGQSSAMMTLWLNSSSIAQSAADDLDDDEALLLQQPLPPPPPTLGRRTAVLDGAGQFYYGNGTAVPLDVSTAAFRRAARLGLLLRPTDDPLDAARRGEATAMGAYGASPVKLQYPGEPSFNGITGPLGSIDYDDGAGAECFRYLPGCLACDKFYTVAPGVGALFQYRCLACLQPEYQLNGIKCECGPGFGIPATLGTSGGPKPSRGLHKGYGGQATMYTTCQRCPGNFFLDPAYSSSGATMGPACIRCPRNTKSNPDQTGCGERLRGEREREEMRDFILGGGLAAISLASFSHAALRPPWNKNRQHKTPLISTPLHHQHHNTNNRLQPWRRPYPALWHPRDYRAHPCSPPLCHVPRGHLCALSQPRKLRLLALRGRVDHATGEVWHGQHAPQRQRQGRVQL